MGVNIVSQKMVKPRWKIIGCIWLCSTIVTVFFSRRKIYASWLTGLGSATRRFNFTYQRRNLRCRYKPHRSWCGYGIWKNSYSLLQYMAKIFQLKLILLVMSLFKVKESPSYIALQRILTYQLLSVLMMLEYFELIWRQQYVLLKISWRKLRWYQAICL
jgi:hypothetical protein